MPAVKPRKRVALVIETSLAYGRAVLRGISKYLVAHQPWSMYLDLHELMAQPPRWLENAEIDGVISRSTTPELAASLLRRRIPTIDMTDFRLHDGLPHVYTDHRAVGKLAAEHLQERGFRQFAYCGFSDHAWSSERREGFANAITGHGALHVYESRWQTSSSQTWAQQQQEIRGWLEALPKPIGIMAANDMRGHHVLDACRQLELAVPESVAVIGVDNDEVLCELCDPPLSSVVPNPERIGYEAAAMLDRMMAGDSWPTETLYIPPMGIVTRQSTDVLATDDPIVASSLKIIREGACHQLTVDEILARVNTSRSVLERRFRKHLGRSPQEEIRQVQLKRVKQLLEETELPLSRIAELSGFQHAEYLSVVFKREVGMTPGSYRKSANLR